MRIGALSQLAPAPGRVVVLRPTQACQEAAEAAPVSPGAPSFLQADHLDAYRAKVASAGLHRGWTGTAGEFDVAFDETAYVEALTSFVGRHEGLRTWFDLSDSTPVRHVVPADAVAFEAVEVEIPPALLSSWEVGGWEELLVGLWDEQCRPDSWAPFLLGAIVRGDGFTYFWGCDHAFTDGASQLMVPAELGAAYAAATGASADPLPEAGSFVAYAADEQQLASTCDAQTPAVREWAEIVSRHEGRLPRFPVDLGLAPGETAPVRVRAWTALDEGATEAFEQLCRAAGGRFTSGVFALLAHAEQRLTGIERYLGITVLGTRSQQTATSHGWFCNFAPVEMALGQRFEETLLAAESAFATARELAKTPVHVPLGAMIAGGVLAATELASPQMVSFLDVRKFPGAGTTPFETGLHFTGEGRTANASLWVNRFADRFELATQSPDTEQGARAVATFFGAAHDVLAELGIEVRPVEVALAEDQMIGTGHAGHDR
ncbi:condensation domain-containing protein [Nocardioides albertanoniae]|uniref:Condensation domain-containing protein n=1 Tax=Nocardioides albertanoniae TaxID=1175486 RepID=A0A543A6I9_9ACTN|nr:condensation domain-containing protein [Nocardioides albertanoniae]TQL68204.1 condensation domain-containing protein [Nocardioides albertanoniae]